MKKAFLTKSIIISVLVVDLAAGGMKIGGILSDGIDQSPIGTFFRAWHDGSLASTLKGDKSDDAEAVIQAAKTVKETADTEASITIAEDTAESTESVSDEDKTYSFVTVDDSYFADACMIGDSRAGCVEYWNGMPGMVYHTVAGYSIYEILEKTWCEYNGEKCTLEMSLSYDYDKFGKVYVETGINGCDYDTVEEYKEANQKLIDLIEYTQPHAIIFLCACMRVTDTMSNAENPVVTNEQINSHNEVLRELADNKRIFYIEINDYCCIEDGSLNPEYTSDGYHMTDDYTYLWRDCFLEHGIVRD